MKRKDALYQICIEIERVKVLCSFTGKANILRRLHRCYDLIDLYKPEPIFYELIVNEAKGILNELQTNMDKESKGGK